MWHEAKSHRSIRNPGASGHRRSLGWLCLLGLLFTQGSHAESIQLTWDPVQDSQVAVYQVHYGPASGQYNDQVETATHTASIPDLPPGFTYYFAVRACDSARTNCSGFSNEVSTTIQVPAPTASFSVNNVSGTAPLTVLFTDNSSGSINSRNWQFDDGGSASNATQVTHTYTVPGTYVPRLSVTGPGGSDTFVAGTPIVVQAPADSGGGSGNPQDSDNDGMSDADEVAAGRNPLVNEATVILNIINTLLEE